MKSTQQYIKKLLSNSPVPSIMIHKQLVNGPFTEATCNWLTDQGEITLSKLEYLVLTDQTRDYYNELKEIDWELCSFYSITYTNENGGTGDELFCQSETTYILTGLDQATEYTIDVRSVSGLDYTRQDSEAATETATTSMSWKLDN